MKKGKYKLSGGDGGCYGPLFGPITAEEIGKVIDSNKKEYMALHLDEHIIYNNKKIEYLVITPRYAGDTIEKLKLKGCTVGVAIVLPNMLKNLFSNGMSNENIEYWAIGECMPLKA